MPASAETNITGAGKEDHVSMGGFSARKAVQVFYFIHINIKWYSLSLILFSYCVYHRLLTMSKKY
jgi:hypothetical protein